MRIVEEGRVFVERVVVEYILRSVAKDGRNHFAQNFQSMEKNVLATSPLLSLGRVCIESVFEGLKEEGREKRNKVIQKLRNLCKVVIFISLLHLFREERKLVEEKLVHFQQLAVIHFHILRLVDIIQVGKDEPAGISYLSCRQNNTVFLVKRSE